MKKIALKDFLGKKVVLSFYSKDTILSCTSEVCLFRDNLPNISEINAVILGRSKDSVSSHKKFKKIYNLPFDLTSYKDLKEIVKYIHDKLYYSFPSSFP